MCVLQTAMLAGADEALSEVAYQYGRNVGLAFQLVDDLLDFVSSSDAMGKPTAADLKLGLATAPVLFACERVSILTLIQCMRHIYEGPVVTLLTSCFSWMSIICSIFLSKYKIIDFRIVGISADQVLPRPSFMC